MSIVVPLEGRPTEDTSSDDLIGVDGNAFAIIGRASVLLRRAGASPAYISAFTKEATSGDYDHVIQTAVAYLDAEPQGLDGALPHVPGTDFYDGRGGSIEDENE